MYVHKYVYAHASTYLLMYVKLQFPLSQTVHHSTDGMD